MTCRVPSPLAALLLAGLCAAPAAAQSREQRQMMADVRMLQEQGQTLENLLGSIQDMIKAVNARIDEQAGITRKSLADQKLVVDSLSNTVREIREKLDDNTVRLGSLSDEVEALRQGVQQLGTLPAPPPDPGALPPAPGAASPETATPDAAPPVATAPPPTAPLGTSPQKLFEEARADYSIGQWDLAITGFEAVIKYFPKSERAADAQLYIGHSHAFAGNNDKAIDAYDAVIRTYPMSAGVPEAYYKKGLALKNLKRTDEAKAAFESVVKNYPESNAAILAKQGLAQLTTQK
jgi:tol-pal system protein YbgF